MKKTKFSMPSIVLTAAVLFIGASHSVGSPAQTYRDPEGYQLLSMMLEREAKDWEAHNLQVKNLQVYSRNSHAFPCRSIPEEFRAAADDLEKIPVGHFRFSRKFMLRYRYTLSDAADIEITAVGFDSSRTHAVAYITRGCGSMCSGGFTYLFRKNNQSWEIASRLCETMS